MYNHALDLFVLVAELGSFSKAAEKSFITPSAVIQKINHLEDDLGVRLFERSKKGVSLTAAGQYLLSESKELIERSSRIRSQLATYADSYNDNVLFGTNQVHVAHLIYDFWPAFSEKYPGVTFSSYAFNKDATDVRPETDLIEGILYEEPAWQNNFSFCPITYTTLSLLVSEDSPLASCESLSQEQLEGRTIVAIEEGVSLEDDRIKENLREAGLKVEEVSLFSPSVMINCLKNEKPVVIPNCWRNPHPHSKTIPFLPEYRVPYGFFISNTASAAAKKFISFLSERSESIEPL